MAVTGLDITSGMPKPPRWYRRQQKDYGSEQDAIVRIAWANEMGLMTLHESLQRIDAYRLVARADLHKAAMSNPIR